MQRRAVLVSFLGLCTIAAPACRRPDDLFTTPAVPGHQLEGTVTDAMSGLPLQGALLEARSDPGESSILVSSATAGTDGRYRLVNLPSVVYVRVTKYRYELATARIDLTATRMGDFAIAPDPNIPDLNGSFTLTIEADASCPTAARPLPPNLRLPRIFPVEIQHVGDQLTVVVDFPCAYGWAGYCTFRGRASNSGATFSLTEGPGVGFIHPEDLVEGILLDNHPANLPYQDLAFLGTANTNYTATGLLGKMGGTMIYYPHIPGGRLASTADCATGRFELTRR